VLKGGGGQAPLPSPSLNEPLGGVKGVWLRCGAGVWDWMKYRVVSVMLLPPGHRSERDVDTKCGPSWEWTGRPGTGVCKFCAFFTSPWFMYVCACVQLSFHHNIFIPLAFLFLHVIIPSIILFIFIFIMYSLTFSIGDMFYLFLLCCYV